MVNSPSQIGLAPKPTRRAMGTPVEATNPLPEFHPPFELFLEAAKVYDNQAVPAKPSLFTKIRRLVIILLAFHKEDSITPYVADEAWRM